MDFYPGDTEFCHRPGYFSDLPLPADIKIGKGPVKEPLL
jgi:hypothetical protein